MAVECDDAQVPSAITLVLPEVELHLGFFPLGPALGFPSASSLIGLGFYLSRARKLSP